MVSTDLCVETLHAVRPFFYAKHFCVETWTLFAPSVRNFIFELRCTSVESYARLYVKTSISFFRTIRRPHVPPTRRQAFLQQQFVLLPLQPTPVTPIVLMYEEGDAVRIEPRSPSPTTCRLCARSLRTFFLPQASGDGTRMQSVLGESRASCRLSTNSRVVSNSGSKQQQYEELIENS